jgi:hypothetical protein
MLRTRSPTLLLKKTNTPRGKPTAFHRNNATVGVSPVSLLSFCRCRFFVVVSNSRPNSKRSQQDRADKREHGADHQDVQLQSDVHVKCLPRR